MNTDYDDMVQQIHDLTDDLERAKDDIAFWRLSFEEEYANHQKLRKLFDERGERISRAIDAIALTDKTRDGLRILRIARVRDCEERLAVGA